MARILHIKKKQVWVFTDAVQLISRTANIGDSRSTITHPQTTTHNRIATSEQERIGIIEQLVRISV
ncbi:PLP-dependent transferase [Undibacterium sp. RTI2.2]